jgi:hypothetical protein
MANRIQGLRSYFLYPGYLRARPRLILWSDPVILLERNDHDEVDQSCPIAWLEILPYSWFKTGHIHVAGLCSIMYFAVHLLSASHSYISGQDTSCRSCHIRMCWN